MEKIVISGSIKFFQQMKEIKTYLINKGYNVVAPREIEDEIETSDFKKEHNVLKEYYGEIKSGDALLVANYSKNNMENYIGGNTLLEMGFAFIEDKPIFLLNPIPQLSYTAEIETMSPIILKGEYKNITKYLTT